MYPFTRKYLIQNSRLINLNYHYFYLIRYKILYSQIKKKMKNKTLKTKTGGKYKNLYLIIIIQEYSLFFFITC